jgi:hypothetical protein
VTTRELSGIVEREITGQHEKGAIRPQVLGPKRNDVIPSDRFN